MRVRYLIVAALAFPGAVRSAAQEPPELIVHNARIYTVDRQFSVRQAMAIRDGRIERLGSDAEVSGLRGPRTEVADLAGRTVLPGLMDSHVHPGGASMTEFDHPVPQMETIADVLAYVRSRAEALPKGTWIQVRQVFITRLREQRYPTRAELDQAAPEHPVVYSTGPDAALNSLALARAGIGRDSKVPDGSGSRVEKDPESGEPTGILRGYSRIMRVPGSGREASEADRLRRLRELLKDYNSVGITSIGDRDTSPDELERYRKLRERGELTLRVSLSHHVDTGGALEEIQSAIRRIGGHPLRKPDPLLRLIGIKTYLDGGMLTGSAYMRQPWGVSKIYGISDPEYRGVRFIPPERLLPIVRTTVEQGLQFTAHSVGDGAVHALLDAYTAVNRDRAIRGTRPCITHSNFMSKEAVESAARMGVAVDIQPAWLYLDTRTLVAHFGYDRLRYFQPLRSLFKAGAVAGGGSDHMQKIGSLRSVNPYNPFLGIWITLTRKARDYDRVLHLEEALTREQAVRFYTTNNAHILFRDEAGSLEPGKAADFIVLDRNIMECPVDEIRDTQVLRTYLGGKLVFRR